MTTFSTLPSEDIIASTATAIEQRGIKVHTVENGAAALTALKSLLPAGAEVMTGSSTTLNQIGFTEFLQSPDSGLVSVGAGIWQENDEAKRGVLRRKAAASDYFVASVNAVAQTGELVAVDATGSRVTSIPFAAGHVILVVGAQKITPDVATAMQRIREYVYPQENERAQAAYGMGSTFGKWVIVEREVQPGRMTVILVKEALGF